MDQTLSCFTVKVRGRERVRREGKGEKVEIERSEGKGEERG